jgi:transglutaminase-like putative cysteine protease
MLYADHPTATLKVTVVGRVLTEDRAGVAAGIPGDLPPPVFLRETPLTHANAQILALADTLDAGDTLQRLHLLAGTIHGRMNFLTGATGTGTSAADAIGAGAGVCQDFAHIFIAVARALGIPARYISGHLFRRDGAVLQEAAHAWAEAWVEDLGWVAFDPTNGISADDAYIRVCAGLDYRDAAPFVGARSGGGDERLAVDVQVRQVRSQAQSQSQS